MKPIFRPRTFAPIPEESKEAFERARQMWREYYRDNPDEWKKRCDMEHRTYENMVQQYVEKYGFRPDNDKLTGWDAP